MIDELAYSLATYPALYALWALVLCSWTAAIVRWSRRLRHARKRANPSIDRPSPWRWLRDLFLQGPIWRRRLAGLMHTGLFVGGLLALVVLLLNHYGAPRGEAWSDSDLLHALIDIAHLLGLLGLTLAAYRRIIRRELPGRLDDHLLWGLLALALLASLFANALLVSVAEPDWEASALLSALLARPFDRLALPIRRGLYGLCWSTLHAAIWAIALLAPWSKWRHILLAPLSLATRRAGDLAPLNPIDLEHDGPYGAESPCQLTRKERLDALACTRCGRCRDVCPAQRAGRGLDPLALLERVDAAPESIQPLALWVGESALWDCTTCMACDAVCPLGISIRDLVVDLRRERVLDAGALPSGARGVMDGLARQGNPWGLPAERALSPADLGLRTIEPGESCDILLWLGCMDRFDPTAQQAARALVELLHRAERDVATLAQPTCCGDPARRLGNEYLWREQAETVIESLAAVRYQRLVTLCPHCLNALGREYADLGAEIHACHALALLDELLTAGQLTFGPADGPVSYHDPCYLGRGLGDYQSARRLIAVVPGVDLVELPESGPDALCCGGGGGQMWLEESGPSLATPRAHQIDAASAGTCLTACPYCRTMLGDAAQTPVQDLVVWLASLPSGEIA